MPLAGSLETWFSRSIGYPLIVNGNWRRSKSRARFKQFLRTRHEMQSWPLWKQQAHQLERLRELLHHAGIRVPYYRDLFASIRFDPLSVRSLQQLEALPLLTKDIIREQAARLVAEDAEARGSFRNSSGGSTGHPLTFLQDANYRDHTEAAIWTSDRMAGRRTGDRIALLWGSNRDTSLGEGLKGLAYSILRNEWWYNSFDMSEDRMHRYHRSMQHEPPDLLVAYASSAYLFASFLEANHMKPAYPRVSIIPSAEVLRDDMREVIERVFDRPVFNRYGSREVGIIASECESHLGMHVNTADLVVECVGDDVYESPGELAITQLNNYAMPFIRYRIEDMAVLENAPCACGREAPLIRRVLGRTTDTIRTRAGDLIHGEYFTHLFYGVRGIAKFQFVQETLDSYRLTIVPGAGFEPSALDPVKKEILKAVGEGCAFYIERVDDIPPTESGKFLFTVSKVPLPFAAPGERAGDRFAARDRSEARRV